MCHNNFSITIDEKLGNSLPYAHVFYFDEAHRQRIYKGLNDIAPYDCINGDTFSFELAPRRDWDDRPSNFEFDMDHFDEVIGYLMANCSAYESPDSIL